MSKAIKDLQGIILDSGGVLPKYGADGGYGRETSHAIDNMRIPNWLKVAMKEIGVREIYGIRHSERVLEYHSVSGGFSTDEIPWCASYVNWVMLQCDYDTMSYPARAKSWLNFGVSSVVPVVGSIAIKSRNGGGHVCFVVGKNSNGELYCLGGNQGDEVNIKLYPSSVFIAFRVPEHYKGKELPQYSLNLSENISEA